MIGIPSCPFRKDGPLPSPPIPPFDPAVFANVLKPSKTITNPNKEPLSAMLPGGGHVVLQPGQSVEVKG